MANSEIIDGGIASSAANGSASGGAVTVSTRSGIITTDSITTTGQSSYSLTITNSSIASTDLILGSVANGTNTTGIPVLAAIAAGAGVITAKIINAATTATNPFGGTLKLSFAAIKAVS